jgi:hypothetical protein
MDSISHPTANSSSQPQNHASLEESKTGSQSVSGSNQNQQTVNDIVLSSANSSSQVVEEPESALRQFLSAVREQQQLLSRHVTEFELMVSCFKNNDS